MNWNDPKERLTLIERVGATEYSRMFREWQKQNTVATVNGFPIRKVVTRWGLLYAVDGTEHAFPTLTEARAFAKRGN